MSKNSPKNSCQSSKVEKCRETTILSASVQPAHSTIVHTNSSNGFLSIPRKNSDRYSPLKSLTLTGKLPKRGAPEHCNSSVQRHRRTIHRLQLIVLVSRYNPRSSPVRVSHHRRGKTAIEPGWKLVQLKLSTKLPRHSPVPPPTVGQPPSVSPSEIYRSRCSFLATIVRNIIARALKSALHHLRSRVRLCLFVTVKSYPTN